MIMNIVYIGEVMKEQYKVEHIDAMLFALLGSHELVKKWWLSPNKYFDMRTPKEVWDCDQGGDKEVFTYVMSFCY